MVFPALLPLLSTNLSKLVIIIGIIVTLGLLFNALYNKGYDAGYNKADLEHKDRYELLVRANKSLENKIESAQLVYLAQGAQYKADSEKRVSQILTRIKGIKLTNPDCSPSVEFKGAWNEISNAAAASSNASKLRFSTDNTR